MQAAVPLNSQHLHPLAAIRFGMLAGDALTTIQIRFDATPVARLQPLGVVTNADDFNAQFVTQDSRKTKEGLFALECMQICSANADSAHSYECFIDRKLARQSAFS